MSGNRTAFAALIAAVVLAGCSSDASPEAAPRTVGTPKAPLDLSYRVEPSALGDNHRRVVIDLAAHTTVTRIVVTTERANGVEVAAPQPGAVLAMKAGQTTSVSCDTRLLGGPQPSFDVVVQIGPAQRQALRVAVVDPPSATVDGTAGAEGASGRQTPRGAAPGPAPQVVQMPDGERMVIQHGTSADAR